MQRHPILSVLFSTCLAFLLSSPLAAQQLDTDADHGPSATETAAPAQTQQQQIEELERRVQLLAAEVEKLRSGETPEVELSDERRRALGLAPSAAATYRRATQGISFAGYGEMLLENFASENEAGRGGAPTTRLDFLRAILYAGYRFNDKFLFNSEIEIEHAGETSVEFAYVD
ncbi:MAG: hypothetical protein HY655_15575, partial [Acidobacteria bacterium]|nr:hypothetical protein [Acidobacteriota bacterium]